MMFSMVEPIIILLLAENNKQRLSLLLLLFIFCDLQHKTFQEIRS